MGNGCRGREGAFTAVPLIGPPATSGTIVAAMAAMAVFTPLDLMYPHSRDEQNDLWSVILSMPMLSVSNISLN